MKAHTDLELARQGLGAALVARRIISPNQLSKAQAHRRQRGGELGHALVELGLVTEGVLASEIARREQYPSLNLEAAVVDRRVANELGATRSRSMRAVAVNRIAGVVTIALERPHDEDVLDALERVFEGPLLIARARAEAIEKCLDALFPKGFEEGRDLDVIANSVELTDAPAETRVEVSEDSDQPVVQLVRGIFDDAVDSRASDIHFEPRQNSFCVRFRVDGALIDRLHLDRRWLRPCMSRLKIMADLDIAQRRLPQDGRIRTKVRGRALDLRLATTPALGEEAAVVRILSGGTDAFTIDELGLDPHQRDRLDVLIRPRDGFVVGTGPTGSGKSTTLHGVLRALNRPDRRIVTLEDPVEHELDEAIQISANPRIGLGFAQGLRSVMRLDPDVILVGEIRDVETARIAVQAALTGHLVLSTLAAIGTVETVSRLHEMGIERYLLADTLRGVISQRLLRRICSYCRFEVRTSSLLFDAMGLDDGAGPFFAGRGCDRCRNTGCAGRIPVFEILVITPELAGMVSGNATSAEIRSAALRSGLDTLRADGLRKAAAGEVTLEEVYAVTAGSSGR